MQSPQGESAPMRLTLPVGLPWRKCTCHGIGDKAVFPLKTRSEARSDFIHDGILAHSLLA